MKTQQTSRRSFLKQSSLATAGALAVPYISLGQGSANGKLNVGFVGVANRAGADLAGVAAVKEAVNVAAICDIDDKFLAQAAATHTKAKTYHDFRKMYEQKDLDAIVVGTPDHTHAVAAVAALRSGRHVYCEKPLARTISEVRAITNAAKETGKVTQIGTQIHSMTNYRRVVELVRSGAIGKVAEVHVWVGGGRGGKELPAKPEVIPAHLNYDLWLGPVPEVPYSSQYVPKNWRDWWMFSGGQLGDFGCHYMDLPFWALDLKYPLTIEAEGPEIHPYSTPTSLKVRYQYAARLGHPPVNLTWYHGGGRPDGIPQKYAARYSSGVLFIGTEGQLLANYGSHVLLPEDKFAGFEAPKPWIPDSIGHHKEWVMACINGGPTTCHFEYSGPLTEAALLGNVAFRAGKKLEWDAANLKAKNCPEADQFIQHIYRKGWSI